MALISDELAACIAVVGPANSGKTTLLHQLNEKLSAAMDSFYVIKGNPDGTGRYQFRAPDLRGELAGSIKSKWGSATVGQIVEWIEQGRRNLALALVDFGGLHNEQTAEGNRRMLAVCSHYLLVTREDGAGAALWDGVCRERGLTNVGHLTSLPLDGGESRLTREEEFEGLFQVDVLPGDSRNDRVLIRLAARLFAMARPVSQIPYVNLRRPERWTPNMIPKVGGEAEKIAQLAVHTKAVVLGGNSAPAWAYIAAVKRAIDANPKAGIFVFDPKQPQSLVEIPPCPVASDLFPAGVLGIGWQDDGDWHVLRVERTADDKFLPAACAQNLAGAPQPPQPVPPGKVAISGALPMWLFATYTRWLAAAGVEHLGCFDGSMKQYVPIW